MTKSETPSLSAALLIALLANVFLSGQSDFWSRTGLLTAIPAIGLLALTAVLFRHGWYYGENLLFRMAFLLLLVVSSALELLRLWQLFTQVYPEGVTLLGVCCTVLLPVVYLRRKSSLAQTARVLLCLLAAAGVVLLISVAPRLRVVNLQTPPCTASIYGETLLRQLSLYPELLLPALWRPKGGDKLGAGLGTAAVAGAWSVNLLLELFFGAALQQRNAPLHMAARTGAISVFNRLEWLQLILWSAAISLKLALYLYAMVRLAGGHTGQTRDTAVGLDRFPLYFAVLFFLCLVLRQVDMQQALWWRNLACWVFAAVVEIGGGIAWLAKRRLF